MSKIIEKHKIAPQTYHFLINSPLISRHAEPGQFVIIRMEEYGERIPLTIADKDPRDGTITLIVQEVGNTTKKICALNKGDEIRDILGPLGTPSEIENFGHVILVGGGFGIAALYPIAKALREKGNFLHTIIGARTRELLIMEEPMRQVSNYMMVMTDDGTAGHKGLVTTPLSAILQDRGNIHRVIAIGPMPMMRAVAEVTRPSGIKTMVSLNPIMVDGTGMCGGCRVLVNGKSQFACVDGPEFDAHQVDFAMLQSRNRMYMDFEQVANKQFQQDSGKDIALVKHQCKLEQQHPEVAAAGTKGGQA